MKEVNIFEFGEDFSSRANKKDSQLAVFKFY